MTGERWDALEEFEDRLAVIAVATEHFVGVGEIEHLLVDLLTLLQSGRVERDVAAEVLVGLIEPWPLPVEVLEFSMRTLRWPEVRAALEAYVASGENRQNRQLASGVLEVYEADWPGGEIYRTYRTS